MTSQRCSNESHEEKRKTHCTKALEQRQWMTLSCSAQWLPLLTNTSAIIATLLLSSIMVTSCSVCTAVTTTTRFPGKLPRTNFPATTIFQNKSPSQKMPPAGKMSSSFYNLKYRYLAALVHSSDRNSGYLKETGSFYSAN